MSDPEWTNLEFKKVEVPYWGVGKTPEEIAFNLKKEHEEYIADLNKYDIVCPLGLDPKIRKAVLTLRKHGIDTYESCDGGPNHGHDAPTIWFFGDIYAGYKAYAIAIEHGFPVVSLHYKFGINDDGFLSEPCWVMGFSSRGFYPSSCPTEVTLEVQGDVHDLKNTGKKIADTVRESMGK